MVYAKSTALNAMQLRVGEIRQADDFVNSPVVASFAAAAVVACLFLSSGTAPLPALGWAAAFVYLVVHQDVSRLKIPNWLTLPALAAAMIHAGVVGGLSGLGSALAGAGCALGLLFVPFLVGWLGAGDVKAAMVLGALWIRRRRGSVP